jgi:beta-xylosidase
MVCTGGTLPIRTSRDLFVWEETGSAVLPEGKPPWASNGERNWAPEIHHVGGRFVAYYTAPNSADVLSIGAAVAPALTGPYVDIGRPLVEHPDGVIDATLFTDDDGTNYLLYKVDGNAHGHRTPIYARSLSADGLSFSHGSTPVELIANDPGSWEGGVVEAPWLVKREGAYYLFYSGNVYDSRYRTGVARAASVTGPYEKHGAPILENDEHWVGPGHGSLVRSEDTDYFVYHAWANDGSGRGDPRTGRQLRVGRVAWEAGWPKIDGGLGPVSIRPARRDAVAVTGSPQAAPSATE